MLQLSPHWSLHKAGSGAAQKKLKVRLALAALSAGIIYISMGLEIYHEGFTGFSSRYKREYTFWLLGSAFFTAVRLASETHAAPPDLEPAEGRGAAYNYNNFSLTVAGGLGCCLYL